MNLASRSARSAIVLSISTVGNVLVGFFSGLVLARLLSPNDFGTYALALTLHAFVDLRGKLQLDQKFLRDPSERPEHLDTFFSLNMGLSAISLGALIVAALGVTALDRADLGVCLLVIGLNALLESISTSIRLSIEKQVYFGRVALIQSVASLVQFGTTVLAALAGLGLWSFLVGLISSGLLSAVLFLSIAPQRPHLQLNRSLAEDFLWYGLKYGLVYSVSAIVLTNFDNLIIGLIGGTFVLGFYNRAYTTALWPTVLVSTALARISLPTYSKLQDDPLRFSRGVSLVLWVVMTFAAPFAFFFLVSAPELVPTLYGVKWIPSVVVLQVLAAFAILRPLWDDMVSILIASGRPGQMARLIFIQAVFLMLVATPLTWLFSSVGTAISVGLAFIISAAFLFYFVHTHLHVRLWETAGLPLVNNLLALVAYLTIRMLIPINEIRLPIDNLTPWFRLGVEGCLLLALYASISLLTNGSVIVGNLRYLARATRG